jgi:hypothetical protein
MDVAAIGSLLGSLKTATDIAKFVRESSVSLERAELKMKLAQLIEALSNASAVRLNVEQIQLVSVGGQVDCRVVALQGS